MSRSLKRILRATFAFAIFLASVVPVCAQLPLETRLDGDNPGNRLELFAGDGTFGAGAHIADAGDVNGDGRTDVIVSAPGSARTPGRVFLVFGGRPPTLRATLHPGREFIVEIRSGAGPGDEFGRFVAGAGDVNADGFDDVLIGAPGGIVAGGESGVVLLLGSDALPGVIDLTFSPHGVVFLTSSLAGEGRLGESGVGVGDASGDGRDDVVLGIPRGLHEATGERRGKIIALVDLELARPGAFASIDVAALPGENAIVAHGPADGSLFGAAIAPLGDTDEDGIRDFAAGAPAFGGGAVYVYFGRAGLDGLPNADAPDGDRLVEVRSALPASELGAAIAGGRDATGDGAPDLLLGSPGLAFDRVSGAAFLIAGGARLRSGVPSVDVSVVAQTTYLGSDGERAGSAVAFTPDANGDGIAEAFIGAPLRGEGRGAAYLAFGGNALPAEILLAAMRSNDGAAFSAGVSGAGVGSSVGGLEDFSGGGRGELTIGAPGIPHIRDGGVGLAVVVFIGDEATDGAPRHLRAKQIPGGRVHLAWTIDGRYAFQNVYRDGTLVNPQPLSGRLMDFTDIGVERGEHIYFVEANGDPALRSEMVRIVVRTLAVRDLACEETDAGIAVRWRLADRYSSLLVRIDGRDASGPLPPTTTSFFIPNVADGTHLIEVLDPAAPESRATCRVTVDASELPPIEGFGCALVGPRVVELDWNPAPEYDAYDILRNGVVVARVGLPPYREGGVPPGRNEYRVLGVAERGFARRGPPSELCRADVGAPPEPLLAGVVRYGDRAGTTVNRGAVVRLDEGGVEVEVAQVDPSGRFILRSPGDGVPTQLRYRAGLIGGPALPGDLNRVLSVDVEVGAGRQVELRLPVPVILVASREPSLGDDTERWRELLASAQANANLAAPAAPAWFRSLRIEPGITRGALSLARHLEALDAKLAANFGRAPDQVDIVAYGAAGLAARLYLAESEYGRVRRFALLGTPNLGTPRARIEVRGELASRPLDGVSGSITEDEFAGAAEQTAEFLARFNRAVIDTRGARVHLVAGTGGRSSLDPVLSCGEHDDRVCAASALGGIAGAVTHRVAENHGTLGRGGESITVLLRDVLEHVENPVAGVAGGGAENDVPGAAGGVGSSYSLGTFYSGFLEPGRTAELLMLSDTSESIIVILNIGVPGGLEFDVHDPGPEVIVHTPSNPGEGVEYQSFLDGEGHQVQLYDFASGEVGVYTAVLENPVDNVPVPYTVELYSESDLVLDVVLDPDEIDIAGSTALTATLMELGAPITGANATASLWRPNGTLDLVDLLDNGVAPDASAGDGVYTAELSGDEAGLHLIEVAASDPAGTFLRQRTTQLEVRSDSVRFGGELESGLAPAAGGEGDGGAGAAEFGSLWIDGMIEADIAGRFVIAGTLLDPAGETVATAHAILDLAVPQTEGFRLVFPGEQIYDSQRSGPYSLSPLELFDGSVEYVTAERVEGAHETAAYTWDQFVGEESRAFLRGDANGDGQIDISDAVSILIQLFSVPDPFRCADAADADADGTVVITDALRLLNFMFGAGAGPAAPYPDCGEDPALGCDEYSGCE